MENQQQILVRQKNLVYYSSRPNRNISRWSRYVVMYNDWRQRDDIEAVVSTADGTLTGSGWPRESTCVFVPVPFKHQRRRLRYVIQLLTSCSCFPRNIDHDNRCALIDPLPIDRWIAQFYSSCIPIINFMLFYIFDRILIIFY